MKLDDETGSFGFALMSLIAFSDAAMRSEKRGDLSLAWWSRDGRSYLVIGHMPEERAITLAQTLEKRV